MKALKPVKAIVIVSIMVFGTLAGCASGPKVMVVEMENKGTAMNVPTPDWVKTYLSSGISAVQSQFKDRYCIIGSETGINKQFVLAWADNFSAQQQIGAMLRTNIESEYQAKVDAAAQSSGGAGSSGAAGTGSGDYKQEIDNSINAVVNVSYSGAQREADWWILTRRYDPDQKDVYTDEYTSYVLYTIPKAELNRQIAAALETSVSRDSELYGITIALAKDILLNGVGYLSPQIQNDNAAIPTDKQTSGGTSVQTSGETSVEYESFTALRTLDSRSSGKAVFTPDSKAILAYGQTGIQGYIKLWDVETGEAIRTIREATGFSNIAISPDGKRFVTSPPIGNVILLWDFATGAYRECRGHTDSGVINKVTSLAFSPDGNYFISGSSDKTIKIWNADTGEEIRTLTGHTGTGDTGIVLSVSYSPDGRQIVSCSNDKTIKFWDVSSGNVIQTISANCSEVSYCPDGRKIAAVEGSKIHIFDSQNGQELFTLSGHRSGIREISFSPDGSRLLSGEAGSGSNIIVWNMSNGWEIGRLNSKDTSSGISSLVISNDGKYFAISGAHITIWGEE